MAAAGARVRRGDPFWRRERAWRGVTRRGAHRECWEAVCGSGVARSARIGDGVGVAVAGEYEGGVVLEAPLTESEGVFDAVEGGSPDRRAANRRAACQRR